MNIRNKKEINLIKLTILILVVIILINALIICFNNSLTKTKSASTYNLNQSLWKFRFNGGLLFQISASSLSYLGISIASLLDQDIRNDMETINWNIFNTNERAVINSEKVSFYKGVPVFKFSHNRSGSFLAIFISKQQKSTHTLRHEFGHNIQQLILGPIKYLLCIGLPSWQEWSNRYYYDRPWEITADTFGGITSIKHNEPDISRGYSYLDISALFGILSYSFIVNEY